MNKTRTLLCICLIILVSCTSKKVSCDSKESRQLLSQRFKLHLTKEIALRYAYYDYSGSESDYKSYLKTNFDLIDQETGQYFEKAKKDLSNDTVLIENITTQEYHKDINKCDCEASLSMPGTKIKDQIRYDVSRNEKGKLMGHYNFPFAVKIREHTYEEYREAFASEASQETNFEKTNSLDAIAKNEAWPKFWSAFKYAFRNKNKERLIELSSEDFFAGGSGDSVGEWLDYIFSHEFEYSQVLNAINSGTNNHTFPDGSQPMVTGSGAEGDLYFDYKNGKWLFSGLIGD